MAHGHSRNHTNLGNGIQEIEFFPKDIDYDMMFYKNHVLKEDKEKDDTQKQSSPNKETRSKNLIQIWEEGGPVKALRFKDVDAYPLYFHNFQNYDYDELKELLGNFFTLCEFENLDVRVSFRDENDLRTAYKKLKNNKEYNVWVNLDTEGYKNKKENNIKQNDSKLFSKNKNLIQKWLNKEEVVCETSRPNSYPVQIYNYKHLKSGGLMKLFSKYGEFISIVHSENECVQVKFCDEEAARNCYEDLRMDTRYNVKLLFFLKQLNSHKKLVKDVLPCNEEVYISRLLAAEGKIQFTTPNESFIKKQCENKNKRERNKCSKGKNNSAERGNIKYASFSKDVTRNNVYVEGTPLHNTYLNPPYSYKVWYNQKNYLPPPTPEPPSSDGKDVNYEYYLECIRKSGGSFSNMHSSF